MKTIGKKFDRWYDLLWMQKKTIVSGVKIYDTQRKSNEDIL